MDPRMRKRDKGTEKWFEEIMSESFPKLSGEENRYPSQGSQRKMNPKISKPRYIISKLKTIKEDVKSSKRKTTSYVQYVPIKLSADIQ